MPVRVFGEELKRKVVADVESGNLRVSAAIRAYGVHATSIYHWLNNYSRHLKLKAKRAIKMESKARRNEQLLSHTAEPERMVEQKQVALDFYEKRIELAGQELKIALKKLSSPNPQLLVWPAYGSWPGNRNASCTSD